MTSIDWGALATFSTGLLALVAAVIVASRQAKILGRQHALLQHQIETDAKLRENDIKLRLIEKRSAIIKELREVQYHFLAEAKLDTVNNTKLWRLVQDAELLFPKEATALLNELTELHFRAGLAHRRAQRQQKAADDGSEASLDEAFEIEQNLFTKFPEALNSLIEHSAVRM